MSREGGTAVVTDSLVVVGGLDLDARRAFVTTASAAIDEVDRSQVDHVGLDCSNVESLDDETLGMLVIVARLAQRRGARATLIRASKRVRTQLDESGVSHFFDWEQ